jgi:transcriptional regulator with XRE-family HTH domain
MSKNLISRRLIQLEITNHLKPQDISLICNVSDATYYRYRAGEALPDYDFLKRLLERFKIDAGWLFDETKI